MSLLETLLSGLRGDRACWVTQQGRGKAWSQTLRDLGPKRPVSAQCADAQSPWPGNPRQPQAGMAASWGGEGGLWGNRFSPHLPPGLRDR